MSQAQRKRLNRDWGNTDDREQRWENVRRQTQRPTITLGRKARTPLLPLKKLLWEGVPLFACAFFCALGTIGGFLMPFGVAICVATMMLAPNLSYRPLIPAGFAAAGGALGLLFTGSVGQAVAVVLLFGLWLLTRRMRYRISSSMFAVAAGICALACQWLFGPRTTYDQLMAILSAAATAVLVPVYHTALSIKPRSRSLLSPEELICAALTLMTLVGGIQGLSIAGFSPAFLIACVLVMTCGLLGGPTTGAAAGALLGACLMLGAANLAGMVASLGVAGLLAGAFKRLGRIGAVIGFSAGMLAASAIGGVMPTIIIFAQVALAGIAIFAFPRKFWDELRIRADRTENIASQTRARDERSCVRANARLGESMALFHNLSGMLTRDDADENSPGALIARQYAAIAQEMAALREDLGTPEPIETDRTRMLGEALDRGGLIASDAAVYRTREGLRARMRIKPGANGRDGIHRLGDAATRACGRRMRMFSEKSQPDGTLAIEMEEAPLFDAMTGVSCRPKAEGPCGDSHAFARLPDGRFMMAIADGMGSGRAAANESDQALTLLEQFLRARINPENAIRMINDLLVLRGGEEMYTTLDLCILDMREGAADFYKIGAVNSYIRRGAEVIDIVSGSLPMGILGGVTPAHQRVGLRDGDTLVMVSDGIADAVREEGWLMNQLMRIDPRNPQSTADLIEASARFEAGYSDDRTVLCARVFRR